MVSKSDLIRKGKGVYLFKHPSISDYEMMLSVIEILRYETTYFAVEVEGGIFNKDNHFLGIEIGTQFIFSSAEEAISHGLEIIALMSSINPEIIVSMKQAISKKEEAIAEESKKLNPKKNDNRSRF